jgi:hypothetical protein
MPRQQSKKNGNGNGHVQGAEPKKKNDALAKIEQLFALATDDGAEEGEARNAAVKCLQLMKEGEFAVIARTELETLQGQFKDMNTKIEGLQKAANGQALKWGLIGAAAAKFLKV